MTMGCLKVVVSISGRAVPLPLAMVYIQHEDGTQYRLSTNASGETDTVQLSAPDPDAALDPDYTGEVYSTCSIYVVMQKYRPVTVFDIQIYPGEDTVQYVSMDPEDIDRFRLFTGGPTKQITISPPAISPASNTSGQTRFSQELQSKILDTSWEPGKELQAGVGVLQQVVIPAQITVHLGTPTSDAQNVTVSFPDYIKNVCCSEIYSDWPENALIANIYCQISLALNRIYTEWYRSKGYYFDITNSTSYDQYYVVGQSIPDNVSRLVDNMFTQYVQKVGSKEPYYTEYCNGSTVTCAGLSQWGTVTLAENGYTPLEILQYYYGDDIVIKTASVVEGVPSSYPGTPLTVGSTGSAVTQMQTQLLRIRKNYPLIPDLGAADGTFGANTQAAVTQFQDIFNLTADGIVGQATWYKISYIYVAVTKLAELGSEGIPDTEGDPDVTPLPNTTIQYGSQGTTVTLAQFLLDLAADFYDLSHITVDGIFGGATQAAVIDFQYLRSLDPDGIIGTNTWNQLYNVYYSCMGALTWINTPYGGVALRSGSSGDDVALIQRCLNVVNEFLSTGSTALTIDGKFGSNTQTAVRAYQTLFGLDVDGVVGLDTWTSLVSSFDYISID